MIELRGVTKRYDDKVAVDDLSLEVAPQSIFGLIGPNGAGKTTTLRIIATLSKAERGSVRVCGHDLAETPRRVRGLIGYMPDHFGTFRGLTSEDYLKFFGRAYGLWGHELDERVAGVLELTDLEVVRDEQTTALSAGMSQRLALAKTLLHDPSVLVLDEPASGLDPRARIEVRSLLKELGRMGKTLLISSHILADLEEICTDVGIIEAGKLVWQGSLAAARETSGELAVTVTVRESDADTALTALKTLDFVAQATRDGGGRIHARLRESRTNELLAAIVSTEVEVLAFSKQEASLESLFLARTKGIVS